MGSDEFASWWRTHPVVVDLVLAALVLAAYEMPAFDPYRHDGGNWWAFLGLALAAPMLWRRRAPAAALAVAVVGAAWALMTRSGPNWGILSEVTILLGPAIVLAYVGTVETPRTSRRLAVATAGVLVVAAILTSSSPDALEAQLLLVGGAWLAGETLRARRRELELLQELVVRRGRQAADHERARIARELHDVAAHHLSVIAIHAGAARLMTGPDSPAAESLATIENESRLALTDVRRALGVLRRSEGGDSVEGLSPPPGLAQIDCLADRLRQAGLPLAVTVTGDLSAVSEAIATSAYRVVQEALTNVLNHAGRVPTQVRVAVTSATIPGELELDVINGRPVERQAVGDGGSPGDGGHGLIGMQERVAAYGGSIDAASLRSGGFRVTARIPLPAVGL